MAQPACTIYCVGKTKHPHWAALEQEYSKRLQHWISLDVRYYKTEQSMIEALRSHDGLIVLLDETGKQFTSSNFSDWLEDSLDRNIAFVIGDTDGASDELKHLSQQLLSLSKATWTHEMARVLLIEQLYRAKAIAMGHPYHRA